MKRPRVRKWAKWVCTLAAVLAVGAAVFSGFYVWGFDTNSNSGDTAWGAGIGHGQIVVCRAEGLDPRLSSPSVNWPVRWLPGWYWGFSGEKNKHVNVVACNVGVLYRKDPHAWEAGASMLYPVALTLFPAALLWYADRRRFGPGLCKKCGYDRRGISADAKCPECGKAAEPG